MDGLPRTTFPPSDSERVLRNRQFDLNARPLLNGCKVANPVADRNEFSGATIEMKQNKDKGLFKRSGSPNWWIRYSDRNGHISRMSTGTTMKSLARDILNKKKAAVAENRHLDVKKIPNTTFFELCEKYWEECGKHLRTKGLLKIKEETQEDGTKKTVRTGM